MNSIQIIELIIAGIFIAILWRSYKKTKKRIEEFRDIFPRKNIFNFLTYYVNDEVARTNAFEALVLLENYYAENPYDNSTDLRKEQSKFDEYRMLRERTVKTVELISLKSRPGYVLAIIVNALNAYLLKNKGFASDYKLIKDIIERNTARSDSEIKQYLYFPFYIGLLGAFCIALFALFTISDYNVFFDMRNLNGVRNALHLLLNGFTIAAFVAFVGLLLSFLNKYNHYNKAYKLFESRKNDFYTLLQTELMPILNKNVNSTFEGLQKNLNKFNDDFERNIDGMNELVSKNFETLQTQAQTLAKIEGTDNMQFAKANLLVLEQLQLTTERYSEFNNYLDKVNQMMIESREYTAKINELIERTEDFKNLGNHIIQTFQQNQSLIDFLQQHYNSLDESRQLIYNSVGKVNTTLNESLETLKSFAQTKIHEVQKIINKETEMLANRPSLFSDVEKSNSSVSAVNQNNFSDNIEELNLEIDQMNDKLNLAKNKLERLRGERSNADDTSLLGSLKNLFRKK